MATSLTNRQKEVLGFIRHTIEEQGYPPSQREIADHFQMVGILGVQRHLLALEKKGYVRRGKGARAIEVLGHASGRSVPILGKVAAGSPILAEEYLMGHLMLDPTIARWEDVFLLKVQGGSMKDAGILDGDLVLVKPQRDAESGEIVVAMIEGEATVKQLIKEKNRVVLKPKNDAFAPIVITKKDPPLQILGKVEGLFRLDMNKPIKRS
ncbi:MAG: transcriptional repressor LexA [Nitrospira sp.]|nr:transcriptional repressor LexA [Candidatus Manganitrophaceae bacterium]HIL34435.1 transcriptional repressor LexA [Candidatus Manganitrophaceae bacterium]